MNAHFNTKDLSTPHLFTCCSVWNAWKHVHSGYLTFTAWLNSSSSQAGGGTRTARRAALTRLSGGFPTEIKSPVLNVTEGPTATLTRGDLKWGEATPEQPQTSPKMSQDTARSRRFQDARESRCLPSTTSSMLSSSLSMMQAAAGLTHAAVLTAPPAGLTADHLPAFLRSSTMHIYNFTKQWKMYLNKKKTLLTVDWLQQFYSINETTVILGKCVHTQPRTKTDHRNTLYRLIRLIVFTVFHGVILILDIIHKNKERQFVSTKFGLKLEEGLS